MMKIFSVVALWSTEVPRNKLCLMGLNFEQNCESCKLYSVHVQLAFVKLTSLSVLFKIDSSGIV